MNIYKHFTANGEQLAAFPFRRELAMQAYLIENPGILGLDIGSFSSSSVEIIDEELSLVGGRKSKETDGRIDILATYSGEYIGIVELKLGELEEGHLSQLEDYLKEKDQLLERHCKELLGDELMEDPRFKTWTARDQHREELNKVVEEHLAQAEAEDWLEIFKEEDIPADLIKSIDQVVVDSQVLHRNMILTLPHPLGGEVKLVGNPVKIEGLSEDDYFAPPTLDQHGHEILSELLGYSEDKIKKLKQEEKKNTEERLKHVRKVH